MSYSDEVEHAAQLIADSEARAVEQDQLARLADNELGDWQAECRKAWDALAFIVKHGGMTIETECGEIHCSGFWCAEQARAALAATEGKTP